MHIHTIYYLVHSLGKGIPISCEIMDTKDGKKTLGNCVRAWNFNQFKKPSIATEKLFDKWMGPPKVMICQV